MIKFVVRRRFALSPEVTKKAILTVLKEQIDKVFDRKKFLPKGNEFIFAGTLRAYWKSCGVKARIQLDIEDDHVLCCQIDGKVYSDVFLEYGCGIIILGIVSSFFGWFSWLLWLMIIIGVVKAIAFACSYGEPERQLCNILDAIQFQYGLPLKK